MRYNAGTLSPNMSRVSAIDRLPAAVRTEIDRRLIGNGFSGYVELANDLRKRGFNKISKSGLHRYGQQVERRVQLARVREQLELAGVNQRIAAELTGDATLVIVVDRRNGRARLMNVSESPAGVIALLKTAGK